MTPLLSALTTVLLLQAGAGQATPRVDAASVEAPMPELVVPWLYPRGGGARLIEQNIVPREQDIVRIHTVDPAEVVEAFYRQRAVADNGAYSVVSIVNQRVVANRLAVVTIESVRTGTLITIVATQPEPEQEPDPSRPFPVKKGFRPPPS